MQDMKLRRIEGGLYDLVIEDKKFVSVNGFETNILLNILTDARANKSLVPYAINRRGWMLNILREYDLGSQNWIYDQSIISQDVINGLRSSTINAFRHMISTGQIKNIEVNIEQTNDTSLTINIILYPPNEEPKSYSILWKTTQGFE